ncbi:hypothetical protein [Natronosalvus vescus]|uniref:hypothetical protein n=1 Tax=Natronosalvus vescus TaxID=2953881 RepID=UPI002090FB5C|nr:hypothetical protein [Natronosalvus vescus]
MRVTLTDWVVFLYNLGVVLSGGYAVLLFEIDDRLILFGLTFVFALFWTIYFKFYMRSRLETLAERADES